MFDDKKRAIFSYYDGEKETLGDPLAIMRSFMVKLKVEGFDLAELIQTIAPVDKEGPPVDELRFSDAVDTLLPAIRDAFKVKPLDQGGLTEAETLDLLSQFLEFQMELKKNTEPTLSGSACMDGIPEPNHSPTKRSADSVSICPEPKISKRRPRLKASR